MQENLHMLYFICEMSFALLLKILVRPDMYGLMTVGIYEDAIVTCAHDKYVVYVDLIMCL